MAKTLKEEHLAYYLEILKKPSMSEAEKKDFIAIVTLFYEVLPNGDKIPQEIVEAAFKLRRLLNPRLRACGFRFKSFEAGGDTEKGYNDRNIGESISAVLKLSYAYQGQNRATDR